MLHMKIKNDKNTCTCRILCLIKHQIPKVLKFLEHNNDKNHVADEIKFLFLFLFFEIGSH